MRHIRFRRLRSGLALVLLASYLFAADGSVQRLKLEGGQVRSSDAPTSAPQDRPVIEWTNLEQPGATDDWILGDTKVEVLPNGPQRVLAVHHKELSRVVLLAPIRFRDTPRVTVDCIVRGEPLELRVQLMREGRVHREALVRLEGATETQQVVLNFDAVPAGEMTCDRIALLFSPGSYPVGLVRLRVEDSAAGGSIPPEAFGGIGWIEMGVDARPGTCLAADAPLHTEFQVEDANERLEFSYAMPKSVMVGGAQPRMTLTISADGRASTEHTYEFLESPGSQPAWRHAEVALASYEGSAVRAVFTLEVAKSQGKLAVLGIPKLVLPGDKPPTLLLITSSSHRADHLGFLGNDGVPQTPALDALAAGGVAFLDVLAASQGTIRAHLAMLSGSALGGFELTDGNTLAERFAQLGYETLAVVSSEGLQVARAGFDRFCMPAAPTGRSAQQAIQQLSSWLENANDRPLFVWLEVSDARAPYAAPKRVLGEYYPKDLDPFDPTSPVSAFELSPEWNPLIGDPFYTEALYDGSLAFLDEQLSPLLRQERFASGVIVYIGTQGENLRKAKPFRFGHENLCRSTLSVPLILRAPQLKPGTRRADPVAAHNLGRTLLNLLGHGDSAFPGTDWMQGAASTEAGRLAIARDASSAALFDGEWMLRLVLDAEAADTQHSVQLFRLATDPYALTDLSGGQPAACARLRNLLLERLRAEEQRAAAPAQLDPHCHCSNCESFR